MTKLFLVFFVILVPTLIHIGKAEKLEESTNDSVKHDSDDYDNESASIQVVQRSVNVGDKSKIIDEVPHEDEDHTELITGKNSTETETKYDLTFKDVKTSSGELLLSNKDDIIEEVSITSAIPQAHSEHNNDPEEITLLEHVTKAYDKENSREDSVFADEDENNSRSAESVLSDSINNENESANAELSDEEGDRSNEYIDKRFMAVETSQMDTSRPETKERFYPRSFITKHYGLTEDHGFLDPRRSFNEMMLPRYRPMLTRSGIVYTPTLLAMQSGSPYFDRLPGRNWVSNRAQINTEVDVFPNHHHMPMGLSQFEDSKMIDDYNDYGSNTYSYTPLKKVTTQAPPDQIAAPNKFDVFQKLVEASKHPKSQKRTSDDFSGNYNFQRQYPESYGSFNIRRVRRNTDEFRVPDI